LTFVIEILWPRKGEVATQYRQQIYIILPQVFPLSKSNAM